MPACKIKISLKDRSGGNNRKISSSKTRLFSIIDPQATKENGSTLENFYNLPSGMYLSINEKKPKGRIVSLNFSILEIKEDGSHHFEKIKPGYSLLGNF